MTDRLDEASQAYALDLVESYEKDIPPRDIDRIIDEVEREKGDVTELSAKLSGYVRDRAVKEAVEHIDYSELESKMSERAREALEDAGWDEAPARQELETPEPDFGKWVPHDGASWDRIVDEYNSGNLDARLFEQLQTARAEEMGERPMRA